MKKILFICLGIIMGGSEVFANEPPRQSTNVVAQKLAVEYRLRVQAQALVSGMVLFDDLGMLGRGLGDALQADKEQGSQVTQGGGRLPDPTFRPPSEPLVSSPVYLEMNANGFDPLWDLQVEIEAVQKELRRLKKQKMDRVRP